MPISIKTSHQKHEAAVGESTRSALTGNLDAAKLQQATDHRREPKYRSRRSTYASSLGTPRVKMPLLFSLPPPPPPLRLAVRGCRPNCRHVLAAPFQPSRRPLSPPYPSAQTSPIGIAPNREISFLNGLKYFLLGSVVTARRVYVRCPLSIVPPLSYCILSMHYVHDTGKKKLII